MDDKDGLIESLKQVNYDRGVFVDKLITEGLRKEEENWALRLRIETLEGIIEGYRRGEELRKRILR